MTGQPDPQAKDEVLTTTETHETLSQAHVAVATAFFDLASSRGFMVVGGSALIARGDVSRTTDDLDLFTAPGAGSIEEASRELIATATAHGWVAETVRSSPTFVRLLLTVGGDELVVDLAVDAPPLTVPTLTVLGPTITVEESAGQKMLALFGRAAPRDFVDVYALAACFTRDDLIGLARERAPGFDTSVLREMFGELDRLGDSRLPLRADHVSKLRTFFGDWRQELAT
ncbi:nucleotidyl transferase AbiEii/AbiGii toxin family protein [Isoptericola rhizosphaerae]|uniref:nucleotidyl transferase AbiEii/AbiGii toxin family protein n=1 Tax=Isoptericola rhizosphaerae TaxID=3377837 RepID=UPI00383B3CB2